MGKTEYKTKSNNRKSKQYNGIAKFGSLAFQLFAVVGIGTWIGYWLDGRMQLRVPIFTLAGAMLSLTAIILYLVRQTK